MEKSLYYCIAFFFIKVTCNGLQITLNKWHELNIIVNLEENEKTELHSWQIVQDECRQLRRQLQQPEFLSLCDLPATQR